MIVTFWVCAILAVLGGLGTIFSRKAVHSALSLVLTMVNLAVLYLVLQAPFLGMVQIVVYTGAVMMLFLFVLMVVGVDASDSFLETIKGQRAVAIIGGVAYLVLLLVMISDGVTREEPVGLDSANAVDGGNAQGLGVLIFGDYVLAFEVTAALLVIAALGALVLAHRERHTPRKTQRQLAEDRVRAGVHVTPLPAPGVYARHNAVDTPALLPDGSVSELSIPTALRYLESQTEAAQARIDEQVDAARHDQDVTDTAQEPKEITDGSINKDANEED